MPPVAALRSALAAVPKRFPAISGLHGRAALALASIDPLYPTKISILPLDTDRTLTKRLLDTLLLLDMPVPYSKLAANELEWHNTVSARTLGKDSYLQAGSQLSDTISNYMQLFTVPSPFLAKHNITIIESVRTPRSSSDIYEPCHLYLVVSNDSAVLSQRLPDDLVPAQRVLDLSLLPDAVDGPAITISTQTAVNLMPADDNWAVKSNLVALAKLITNRDALLHNLVLTIIATCEEYVHTSKEYVKASLQAANMAKPDNSRDIVVARKEWSQSAHTELRDVIEPSLAAFARAATWWKLYWVMDDLEEGIAKSTVIQNFLPTSERSLVYVLGQLSTLPALRSTVAMSGLTFETSQNQRRILKVGTSVTDARNRIKKELLPELHWNAQKLVVSTLLLTQLPIAMLAGAGWYWAGYTAYSMGGLGLFGIMLGFKQVQSKWDKLVSAFQRDVYDLGRTAIEQSETEIYNAWEAKVSDLESRISEQQEVVDALNRNLDGSSHSGL